MTAYYEDIDEALAELDDESDDEASFGRRRRRGRSSRGNRSWVGSGAAPISQMASTIQRVGSDVANLEEDTAAAVRRVRADFQNFTMMSALMPLLLKGKTVEVQPTDSASRPVKVAVQSDSTLNMLLPFLMMGQGGLGGSGSQQGSGNNMMMLMMVLVLSDRDRPAT